jgi:hypothetical protein
LQGCPDLRSLLSGTQWLVRLVDHPPRPIAHPKRARPRLELSADVAAHSCPALPTRRAVMPHHQNAVPRRTAVVTRSSTKERQDHALLPLVPHSNRSVVEAPRPPTPIACRMARSAEGAMAGAVRLSPARGLFSSLQPSQGVLLAPACSTGVHCDFRDRRHQPV